MNHRTYKTILFDLGGVLLNIDYNLAAQAFVDQGMSDFNELYSKAKQNDTFDKFERGEISPADFRDYIRKASKLDLEDDAIDSAWNAMLLDFPMERMIMLEKLANDHTLILMSNTNAIHIKAFSEIINNHFGYDRFAKVFDALYYSSEIGKRKPDAETFSWILNQNNLKANECLFIDDSYQHIVGAERVGIDCHHLKKEENVIEVFK